MKLNKNFYGQLVIYTVYIFTRRYKKVQEGNLGFFLYVMTRMGNLEIFFVSNFDTTKIWRSRDFIVI